MKAQMVKNAVIVPVGAKGGFVVKRPTAEREALQEQVVECYRILMRGLLDARQPRRRRAGAPLTSSVTTTPTPTSSRADKGTATFSDVANGIAAEYGFWLGDAFASGGSAGYDHKAMGITARGRLGIGQAALQELDVDFQTTDFTAVGIGDMAGRLRQRDAPLQSSEACRRVQPRARLPRPGPRSGDELRRARAPLRAPALELVGLRPREDLVRRRRVPALGEVDPALTRGAPAARRRG